MKILWFTWKDMKHPLAGGAEVVNEELAKRLTAAGHEIHFVVGGFTGGETETQRDGFRITRLGNRFTTYWHAYQYYKHELSTWPDLVIDEMNTIPYFAKWYAKQKKIMFVHQLAREIWFYQMPFPLSWIGYILEPLYLRLLNDQQVITISQSTKDDLMRYGFGPDHIHIVSEGIELTPLADLALVAKYPEPTILSLGSVRPMKRTLDIVLSFDVLKSSVPNARLILAGDTSGTYGEKVLQAIKDSKYSKDIEVLGRVTTEKKVELMQKSHAIAVTSVKEGWGLIVTEANSQGTPAVVYNVDGLRDSVRNNTTGYVAAINTPQGLAEVMVKLLTDPSAYARMRQSAWEWSKEITFERSCEQFKAIIETL